MFQPIGYRCRKCGREKNSQFELEKHIKKEHPDQVLKIIEEFIE